MGSDLNCPNTKDDLKKDLKRYLGVGEVSSARIWGSRSLNIYIDSLLRTFYGKYIKFGSDKGIVKRIAGGWLFF